MGKKFNAIFAETKKTSSEEVKKTTKILEVVKRQQPSDLSSSEKRDESFDRVSEQNTRPKTTVITHTITKRTAPPNSTSNFSSILDRTKTQKNTSFKKPPAVQARITNIRDRILTR